MAESKGDGMAFLRGGGATGALMRARDWSATPLGPPEAWPSPLRTAVSLMLGARQPVYVAWGPELTSLYNDGYLPIVGSKHPEGFGRPFAELWAEIWSEFRPIVEATMAGEAQHFVDLPIALAGRPDRPIGYFTFSYTALRDDDGAIAGFYCAATETTEAVLARRRQDAETQQVRELLQQAPSFVTMLSGPEHRFEFVNDAYQRLIGPRDVIGLTVREGIPEAARHGFLELLDNVYRTGEEFVGRGLRLVLQRPGGDDEEFFLDFIYKAMRGPDGEVSGIFVEGYDVSERVRAEVALTAKAAELETVLDAAPTAIWIARDPGASRIDGNAFSRDLLRLSPGANMSLTAEALLRPSGFTVFDAAGREIPPHELPVQRAARGEHVDDMEEEVRFEDGSSVFLHGSARPLFGPDGEVRGAVATFADITARKAAEMALAESEARYRTLFENTDAAFCVVEVLFDDDDRPVDHRFIEVNPAFERHSGLKDALGRRARELLPDHEQHWFDIYGQIVKTGRPARFEGGSAALGRWFDVHAMRVGAPEQRRVAILFNDVTERKDKEDRLRSSNDTLERRVAEALAGRKLLADLVEGTDAFVQVADRDYRWLAINRAAADEFERIYGVRPRVGDSMLDALGDRPEHRDAVKAAWGRALAGEVFTDVGEFGDPGRERRCYEMKYDVLRDASGAMIGAYQFVYDVTERVREQRRLASAEDALRQSQKMEALGQLTGGVAHDFNNLLAVISGGLKLLERPSDEAKRRRVMEGMRRAVERGAGLTRQLLAFSRRQPLSPDPLDLGAQVNGMRELLSRALGGDAQVVVEIPDDIWTVEVDAGELELAILNLCVNARDAMPGGGTITVRARNEPGGRDGADEVVLTVSDTGEGMPPEVAARAFEPFFTTKDIGKGSGLGLAQVYGFVTHSGGRVAVDSAVGAGTEVIMTFARSHRPLRRDEPTAPASGAAAGLDGQSGHVLLVEDDGEVAFQTRELLTGMGYTVSYAPSAEAALAAIERGTDIDVVFCDVMMPGGMSGVELARLLRGRFPRLPVILTTGYIEAAREAAAEGVTVLTKPYQAEALAAALRARLHRAA
ncbi:MAG: PAS domain-containing protein [Deltaproteobacteria bacterium]|nr:PAS domain-containing protein [Myxococcales bacterium]MDP3213427.1 PAS domain-containing protein [Deltaproteobacteria bacterium]